MGMILWTIVFIGRGGVSSYLTDTGYRDTGCSIPDYDQNLKFNSPLRVIRSLKANKRRHLEVLITVADLTVGSLQYCWTWQGSRNEAGVYSE